MTTAAPIAPLRSEAAAPERRAVTLALVVINTAFLPLDGALRGFTAAGLTGRLAVSATVLLIWWVTGRPARPAALSRWLVLLGTLVVLGFGLLAAGTGGAASPYAYFIPVLPIVTGLVAPDEPGVPLGAGAAGFASMAALAPPGAGPGHHLFLAAAVGSCTFYGWVASLLYRRLRERERAAAEARERALTALHRSEERRALSERLASLGRLAAGVAHEINNPLAFVGTNLAFVEGELRAAPGADEEVLAALRESRGGLERMKRIVQELRGFARGPAEGPGPVDLAAALEEARRTLSPRLALLAQRGVLARVEVRAAPGLPLALATRAELVQVLVNLLANAADAVEQGGARPGLVEVEVAAAADGLHLAVCDSGPGLSEEALRHAFEPFFSTKGPAGTGLGLALSREFVERWGGRIEAGNRGTGGARVALTLRHADSLLGPGRGGEGAAGDLPPRGAAVEVA